MFPEKTKSHLGRYSSRKIFKEANDTDDRRTKLSSQEGGAFFETQCRFFETTFGGRQYGYWVVTYFSFKFFKCAEFSVIKHNNGQYAIQGHSIGSQFLYQSKAHMDFLLVININFHHILQVTQFPGYCGLLVKLFFRQGVPPFNTLVPGEFL